MSYTNSIFHVPEVIREIHAKGVPGLRFCIYLKGPIRVKYYIQLPHSADGKSTGQTLYIESYRDFDTAMAKSHVQTGYSRSKMIEDLATQHLIHLSDFQRSPKEDDLRYFDWLDDLVKFTPRGRLAITEEPGKAESVQFLSSLGEFDDLRFSLPPGFSKTTLLHAHGLYS